MTVFNTSRGNYNIQNLQSFKINTVQKEWDFMGQKYYDKTTSRAVDANGKSDYKEFPMPSEVDGVMQKLMAIDGNANDFSYKDLKGSQSILSKLNVDVKEYNLNKGILTFAIKGGDGGYNEGKTYSVTVDVETLEEMKAKEEKEYQARIQEETKKQLEAENKGTLEKAAEWFFGLFE